MVSTLLAAKTTGHLCTRRVGRRFSRLCQVRSVAGNSVDGDSVSRSGSSRSLHFPSPDKDCSCSTNNIRYNRYYTSLSTPIGLQQNNKRGYSSSIAPKNNGGKKSGKDHHSFFQEQMLELEKEQKQFGQQSDDDENDGGNAGVDSAFDAADASFSSPPSSSSIDLEEQLGDWKSEQLQVFGETLADHDESGPAIPSSSSSNNNNNEDGAGLEREEEREDRFAFSAEDMAAWEKPNPDPGDMQTILEQIALEREKEVSYAKSASLSPQGNAESSSESSKTTEQQHPPSPEHHDSFSHLTGDGSSVHMVDVGHKTVTRRTAHARSEVWLPREILEAFLPDAPNSQSGGNNSVDELVGPKGPIFATAKIAGIMACKKTSDLIPLCHPLPLDQVQVDIKLISSSRSSDGTASDGSGTVIIDCTCKVTHKTGVEMEALTGATVAALTIYDMTKAMSHNIRIKETRLIGKEGGKRTVLDGIEHKK